MMRVFTCLFFFTSVAPMIALGSSTNWEKANTCFQKFNFKCSIKFYQKSLGEVPSELTKNQRLNGFKKLALSFYNQGQIRTALKVYHRALEIDACSSMSGQAPNVLRRFENVRKSWCKANFNQCQICKGLQMKEGKNCPQPSTSEKAVGCEKCLQSCPVRASVSPKSSPWLTFGLLLSGSSLIAMGIGTGLFFANEGLDVHLRKKLVDGKLQLSQVDRANKESAQALASAGKVVLISGGVLLAGGILSMTLGLLKKTSKKTQTSSHHQKHSKKEAVRFSTLSVSFLGAKDDGASTYW